MATRKFILLPALLIGCFCLAQTGSNTAWYWKHGDYTINHKGIYSYDPQHPFRMPGARSSSASWTGADGSLWLYGGDGYDSAGAQGFLSDLWKFTGTFWTFVKGSNAVNGVAYYNTIGNADILNTPGARRGSASWIDNNGNLWLFGGVAPGGAVWQYQNDLWKFDPVTCQWTWMHGNNISNQAGMYGTQGIANAANAPGARSNCMTWKDNAGNFWLFGGTGPGEALLNDLWKFSPQTSQWTWYKGDQVPFQAGIYGSKGVAAPANKPGSRNGGATWVDINGKLWLHGGGGYAESLFSADGLLNDLWNYNVSTNEWTWVSGDKTINQPAVYGTQGIAAIANKPGARGGSYSWPDNNGNLWLFGGWGLGLNTSYSGNFNDLWQYNQATNQWAWIKGSQSPDQAGSYNVGAIPGFINIPGSRSGGEAWTTPGTFWMFGGSGSAISPVTGFLNDLWSISSAQLSILPVSLTSFWGSVSGYKTCLYWQSILEENFSHYVVQRSRDGSRYESIASVPGHRLPDASINFYTYEDVDAMCTNGKFFYRLEMVDIDGASSLSSVVVITRNTTETSLVVYPNPTAGIVTIVIDGTTDASAQFIILNSSGMEVEERMLKLTKGKNVFTLNVERYTRGIYVLRLRTSKGSIENKLIIQ